MEHNLKHCIVLLLSIGCLTNVYSQSKIQTNQEIISQLFIPPIIDVLKDSLQIEKPLSIENSDTGSLSNWIAQILTDSCLSKNYLVYSDAENGGVDNYSVVISDAYVDIAYHSAGRKWLFFKKGTIRTIRGDYYLTVINPEKRIVFRRLIAANFEDTIPSGSESEIENQYLEFTQGTKSGSPFIKRWLEPVIITITTATVVYLFYTLRSER